MTAMRAISVTIGRDRGPNSTVAPLAPLPDDEWQRFRADVLAALMRIPGQGEPEISKGHTVWDGRDEECEMYSRLWATPTPAQMAQLRAELGELARQHDQDAVVLHDEQRHLITA